MDGKKEGRLVRSFIGRYENAFCKNMSGTMRSVFIVLIIIFISSCNQRAVKFRQIYSGDNGPDRIGAQYFTTRSDLENSWIKKAVSEKDYKALLEQTDFSRQAVLAFSAGEYSSFSGKIIISDVHQYTGVETLPIDVLVKTGVYKQGCRVERSTFPFALAIIDVPPGFQPLGGVDMENFEDGCPG